MACFKRQQRSRVIEGAVPSARLNVRITFYPMRISRGLTMKRRDFLAATTAATAAASVPSVLAAGKAGAEVLDKAWPIRNTESFAFHSKAVGDSLAVGVWQPAGEILQGAEKNIRHSKGRKKINFFTI